MSFWVTGVLVVLAEWFLLAIGAEVIKHLRRVEEIEPQPEGWGMTPEDRKWQKEAEEIPHTALTSVRESAKNWAGSIAALLGVGGTVAFVKGEDTFAKLTTGEGNFAFWLILTSAVMAGVAIALATFAAQGTPRRYSHLNGWMLSKISRDRSAKALCLLMWSRNLTVVAAIALLATLAISWKSGIASEEKVSGVHAYVTTVDGRLRCGELSVSSLGGVSVDFGHGTMQVDPSSELEIVDACPAKKAVTPVHR